MKHNPAQQPFHVAPRPSQRRNGMFQGTGAWNARQQALARVVELEETEGRVMVAVIIRDPNKFEHRVIIERNATYGPREHSAAHRARTAVTPRAISKAGP